MFKQSAVLLFSLLFFLLPSAFAKEFDCGGAHVRIDALDYKPPSAFGHKEVVLTVKKGVRDVRLRFYDVHFPVKCLTNPEDKTFVVFQAYCGGSGCADGENFGIIDSQTLEVLLVPHDKNSSTAEAIFGKALAPLERP